MLDPGFFGAMPTMAEMAQLIAAAIPAGTPFDEVADRARIVGKEQAFRIGVRVLSETVTAVEACAAFSDLASLMLRRLHEAVMEDAERRHGRPKAPAAPSSPWASSAAGK